MKQAPFTWWLTAIAVITYAIVTEPVAAAEAHPGAQPDSRSESELGGSALAGAELTLPDAIAAALRYSPALAADYAEAAAGDARVQQAGLFLNPQLQVDVENVGGSGDRNGVEQSETTFWVTQPLEIGGKRGERQRVAHLGRRGVDYQVEARRLDVVAEVRKRFVGVLLAQERRQLADEIQSLSADALRTVERRIEAGAASPAERAQLRVSLGRARMESQTAERQVRAARRQLATMWGSNDPAFKGVVGELRAIFPPPSRDDLLRALERNPELIRLDTEIERLTAQTALERARSIPNLNLSAGGRHFNDNDDLAAVFTLTVALPVFDRNQAGVLEAEELVGKARAERTAAEIEVRRALLAAYDAMRMQFDRITLLRDEVLADATTASTAALEGYRRGAAEAYDVLLAQRVQFELNAEYFQSLADYQTTWIEVERLTATSTTEELDR